MSSKKRLLLIGWDSADWKIMHPLMDAGHLPGITGLVEGGVSGNLATLEPQLSPMLWTSIATGKMADHHGVYGFTEVDSASGRVVPVSAATRKCRTVWEMLGEKGLRSHIVGWFATHGEQDLNGKMVSGEYCRMRGVAPELSPEEWPSAPRGTYWPEDLACELDELRVSPHEITGDDVLRAFVPKGHKIDQTKDRRLHELATTLAEAYSVQSAATYLMETDPEWDFMAIYFRAVDELSHVFMPYHPPKMEGVTDEDFEIYQDVVNGVYRAHDMMLRRLLHLAGPDTAIMLVSDHGFHSDHLRPRYTPNVPAGITVWHRPQGVFIASGPGFQEDTVLHGARLLDITPTILHYFGLPVGRDMEGRVLTEIFANRSTVSLVDTWERPDAPPRRHAVLSASESEELLAQFVALGYIDEISSDAGKAAEGTRIENDWSLARACLYSGKAEAALPLLEDCHAARPQRTDFSELLARTQFQLGLVEEAEETLRTCMERLTSPAAIHLLMGSMAAERGDHTTALTHLHQVRDREPESLHLLHSLSVSYLALRHWEDADATAQRMLVLDPGNSQAYLILARCHLHRSQPAEAAAAALEAIGRQYGNPRGHFLLGVSLIRLEEWAGAETALRNNLQLFPRNAAALRLLGHVLRVQGRNEEGLRCEQQSRVLRAGVEPTVDAGRLAELRAASAARAAVRPVRVEEDPSTEEVVEKIPASEFTIVSGLPRSGTSLMMQILHAGGVDLMHDGVREADDDNLEGYWEWTEIQSLRRQPEIISRALGKVTKVVSGLLAALPSRHRYKIIFMVRPVEEVAASQEKMIANRGTGTAMDRARSISAQRDHVTRLLAALRANPNVELLEIDFPELVQDPLPQLGKLKAFLGDTLGAEVETLASVVKPELYRNRVDAVQVTSDGL